MRRIDRALSGTALEDVLRRGRVLHLGLQDGDVPYVVPVNYGFAVEADKRVLYFHGAQEGKKLDVLRRNPNAAFCVDLDQGVNRGETSCAWSCSYESVMGQGVVTELQSPEDKYRGLACILAQYAPEEPFSAPEQVLERTAVLRLEITACTGKYHP